MVVVIRGDMEGRAYVVRLQDVEAAAVCIERQRVVRLGTAAREQHALAGL